MDKKWTIGLGLLGILIVFLLLWNFAPAIQRWLASVFVDIILLLAAFAAGMALRTFRRQTPPQRRRTQRTQHHPSSKKVTTSMKKLILLIALALPALLTAQQRDWANYGRYAEANAQLTTPPAVVFMGNSITDGWDNAHPEFFTANNFACRGIGGAGHRPDARRFRADVINLHPQAVVILAGTNDLAQNNGPIATQHIVENIISMAELAMAAGIRPIICSVLPAGKYPWRTEIESVPEKIRDLNARLHRYASDRGLIWVDYYTAMDAGDGSMRSEYTKDGVHPTPEGYDVMERIVLPALAHYCPAAAK